MTCNDLAWPHVKAVHFLRPRGNLRGHMRIAHQPQRTKGRQSARACPAPPSMRLPERHALGTLTICSDNKKLLQTARQLPYLEEDVDMEMRFQMPDESMNSPPGPNPRCLLKARTLRDYMSSPLARCLMPPHRSMLFGSRDGLAHAMEPKAN